MKLLPCVIVLCLTVLLIQGKDYVLQKQKLELDQQKLQLDILMQLQAQQDRADRLQVPKPQKPSLELERKLNFPVSDANNADVALPETASNESAGPSRFLAANPACLPAGENLKG